MFLPSDFLFDWVWVIAMKIIYKGRIALRRIIGWALGLPRAVQRLGISVFKSLQIHGESILIASSYVVIITLMALILFDPIFRTDAFNRLEISRQIVDKAIQGGLNNIFNGFSTFVHNLARHFGGY